MQSLQRIFPRRRAPGENLMADRWESGSVSRTARPASGWPSQSMIPQVHDLTGGMDGTSAGPPGRGLTIEVVHPAENTWDRMTAEFADVTYEQTVAYAASRWGNRRLTGIVVREARGDAVAAALAVVATLPLVRAGVAYVKFGPLW